MSWLSCPPLLVTRTANQLTMGGKKQHAASLVPLRLHKRGVGGQGPTGQQTSKTS